MQMKLKLIPEVETAIATLITQTLARTDRRALQWQKDNLTKRLKTYKTFVTEIESLVDEWHRAGECTRWDNSAQLQRANSLADKTNKLFLKIDQSRRFAFLEFP